MSRKTQFTADDIVKAAFELVREKGLTGLSAPSVAQKMGCSTMPIYSNLKNMQALEDEIVQKVWCLLKEYESKTYTGDTWIDLAVGYVLFARDEPNLFECMHSGRNLDLRYELHEKHWQWQDERLDNYSEFRELDEEQRMRVRYARAMLSHGVATSPNTEFNRFLVDNAEILAGFMTNASRALLNGFKTLPPLDDAKRRLIEERTSRYKPS